MSQQSGPGTGRPRRQSRPMACSASPGGGTRHSDGLPRCAIISTCAPVAQLDRASASGAEGHRFESCRARHSPSPTNTPSSSSTPSRQSRPRAGWLQATRRRPFRPGKTPPIGSWAGIPRGATPHNRPSRLRVRQRRQQGLQQAGEFRHVSRRHEPDPLLLDPPYSCAITFRWATICCQGISGCADLTASDTRRAASPMISIDRSTASWSFRSRK